MKLTPRQILYVVLGTFALTVFVLTLDHPKTRVLFSSWESLRFDNPFKAYHILKKLDIFEITSSEEYKSPTYGAHYWGLKVDNGYCEKHRTYFVENPNMVYEGNFFTDYGKTHQVRTMAVPENGKDLHPVIGFSMPKANRKIYYYNLKPETSMIFTNTETFTKRIIGKQFSCLTQTSNHIPGHDLLDKKELVYGGLMDYSKQYAHRPGCFNLQKFAPKTWFLGNQEECLDFFSKLNGSTKGEEAISYYRKVTNPQAEGTKVFPVTFEDEAKLKKTFKDGEKCGKVMTDNIIQQAVARPLLFEGSKFDIRAFMLVASTNPLMAYYRDGYLTRSLYKYSMTYKDPGVNLAHTEMAKKVLEFAEKSKKYSVEDLRKIKKRSYAGYKQLQDYLRKEGVTVDAYWLDNYLRPQIQKAMIHLLRMSQERFLKKSSIYELYAVDFMLDQDLNLWFIDANSMPVLQGWTSDIIEFNNRMLGDTFEIVSGLLKSRAKRIVKYINGLCANDEFGADVDGIRVYDLERRREEFKKLTSNYFEKEYEPKVGGGNGFVKIVDENYAGRERYIRGDEENGIEIFEPRCF